MRAIFSVVSLLVVVAVIGLLAKKQLTSVGNPTPATDATGISLPASPPGTTPAQRSQQMQQQMKQAIEQAQQPRPLRDDQ
jgi:hypothetical protein